MFQVHFVRKCNAAVFCTFSYFSDLIFKYLTKSFITVFDVVAQQPYSPHQRKEKIKDFDLIYRQLTISHRFCQLSPSLKVYFHDVVALVRDKLKQDLRGCRPASGKKVQADGYR